MQGRTITNPNRLRTLRKELQQNLRAYMTARSTFLAAEGFTARETALSAALDARFWWQNAARRLAAEETLPCVVNSSYCPNVQAKRAARKAGDQED